jgi:transcriptional regulator NrdR family protein
MRCLKCRAADVMHLLDEKRLDAEYIKRRYRCKHCKFVSLSVVYQTEDKNEVSEMPT